MTTFFQDLDTDIRKSLIEQLRILWTHTSTAIEGNTLTLGETAFVLQEGLTVSGKPLKDHKEVEGHARAIKLLYKMLEKEKIDENDLFLLHKAVQTEIAVDIYAPTGAWKKENNGTFHIDEGGRQIFANYAPPEEVPELMKRWLSMLNEMSVSNDKDRLADQYVKLHISFVTIHPFADGNGRLARLLSNIPILRAGFPPIIISAEKRYDYIKALSNYQLNSEKVIPDTQATLPNSRH